LFEIILVTVAIVKQKQPKIYVKSPEQAGFHLEKAHHQFRHRGIAMTGEKEKPPGLAILKSGGL
jgi:hypothetical protein